MHYKPDSLYYGDCLEVLKSWPPESIDLCYLDPPFKSDTDYNILFGKSSGGGRARRYLRLRTHGHGTTRRKIVSETSAGRRRIRPMLR